MFASDMPCFKRCFEAARLFGAPPHSMSSVLEPQQQLPQPRKRMASISFTYSNWELCSVVLKAGQNNRKKSILWFMDQPAGIRTRTKNTTLFEYPQELDRTADTSLKLKKKKLAICLRQHVSVMKRPFQDWLLATMCVF